MSKKKFGDRKDARRVQIPGLMQCCIDLKPSRMENEVYINRHMDVTELSEYLEAKKAEGIHYTYFYAFLAAIGIVMYNRPRLNRFIKNRHLFEHNDIVLSFVAKMTLDDKSDEIMLAIPVVPEDNMVSLSDKISKRVEDLRKKADKVDKKGANSAIDSLGKLPNFIRVPIFGIIKWADRKGILPESLTKDNIYYSSMIISNLGSIHCGAIYHNLANFGTCSSLATMGEIKPQKVLAADGTEQTRKLCEFGITLDERVGDGFYFSKSLRLIEYILQHPSMLEQKIEDIKLDGVL